MDGRLKDKSAVVTGAGRGIGREIALALASEGAKVLVVDPGVDVRGGDSDLSPANEVVAEIKKKGGMAAASHNSVADFKAAEEIIKKCVENFGSIDILVNCAGIIRTGMIWELSEEDWDTVISVHLKGTFNCTRWAAGFMKEQRSGRIINFASHAWLGSFGHANYGAAKGGIVSFTRSISQELIRYGITCNCVVPSATTRMSTDEEATALYKKKYDLGVSTRERYEEIITPHGPEHIPPIVVYLATDEASGINGKVFLARKGKIGLYSEPAEVNQIFNNGEVWNLSQLVDLVPRTLMAGNTKPIPAAPPE
ncbi:SDR family NAD(P)-dependent oxidoreductase [Chloroflexota bacterium]